MAYRRFFPLLVSFLLIAATAGAAELGEPRISSYRGQALVADIELSNLDDPAAPVQVRVANPDVYRGASLSVPPVLSALTLTVVKQGGKQFVHVTSNRPVDTDMLHLFLELGQGSARDVRLATLWLMPDPRPAPPPPVVVAPPSAPVAVPVVVPVAAAVPVTEPARVPAPMPLAAVSTALPVSLRPAPATSCKASAENNACAVLDKKNAALRVTLAGLEGKIKLLQAALAPAADAAAMPAAPPAPVVAAVAPPPPAPVAVVVKPKKPKPAAPSPSSTPWLWIAVASAIALAAVGAIVFLLLRRRRGKVLAAPRAPKGPGLMAGVKSRILARKAAPVEPVME